MGHVTLSRARGTGSEDKQKLLPIILEEAEVTESLQGGRRGGGSAAADGEMGLGDRAEATWSSSTTGYCGLLLLSL